MSFSGVDGLLRQAAIYQNFSSASRDLSNAVRSYSSLRAKLGPLILNTGEEKQLVSLSGTFPITFRGATYNIPSEIFLMESYPNTPPIAYIRPTASFDRFLHLPSILAYSYSHILISYPIHL